MSDELDIGTPFKPHQIALLKEPLTPELISECQGQGGNMLKHIEGHIAISQADRIFGPGNWGYRPLSCAQIVLHDPTTGEAVDVCYQATVELTVKGCTPIVDVGSQPVAMWCIDDWMINFYANAKKYNDPIDESELAQKERIKKARIAIVEAHEIAFKAAVTDALKRCLRAFGTAEWQTSHETSWKLPLGFPQSERRSRQDCRSAGTQFGNSLYGAKKKQKPASPPKPAQITLQQVKAAVRKAGKASDADSWSLYILSTLREPLTDQELKPERLKKLLDCCLSQFSSHFEP